MNDMTFFEGFVESMIWVHVALGGIALFSGLVALSTKKGSNTHKKTGLVFYYSMLVSAVISMTITLMPGHTSPFFFCISLLTLYLLISGKRSLKFKRSETNLNMDRLLAVAVILTGIGMIAYPPILYGHINIILMVFGLVSCAFGIIDLLLLRPSVNLRQHFLKLHICKMIGAYTATVTAFFVVNKFLPGLLNWFSPSVIGFVLMGYWLYAFRPRRKPRLS